MTNDYTPMEGPEFQLVLRKLRVDNETAAAFLGVSVRTVERYTTNDARIPKAAAILLRDLVKKRTKGFDRLSQLL